MLNWQRRKGDYLNREGKGDVTKIRVNEIMELVSILCSDGSIQILGLDLKV